MNEVVDVKDVNHKSISSYQKHRRQQIQGKWLEFLKGGGRAKNSTPSSVPISLVQSPTLWGSEQSRRPAHHVWGAEPQGFLTLQQDALSPQQPLIPHPPTSLRVRCSQCGPGLLVSESGLSQPCPSLFLLSTNFPSCRLS